MRPRIIEFGTFLLDVERGELHDGERKVPLGWRAIVILTALAERAGKPVGRETLIQIAWPDVVVEENNLRVQISAIRKALRDAAGGVEYIQNVVGFGYQFNPGEPAGALTLQATSPSFPALLEPIVGRSTELAFIVDHLSAKRLITVTGLPGVGKTSLAMTAAQAMLSRYPGGVDLLDCVAQTTERDIVAFFDERFAPRSQTDAVNHDRVSNTDPHKRLLLLDRCERLASGLSDRVDAVLSSMPHVDCIATSRVPLASKWQTVIRIEPLPCPPANIFPFSADDALHYPAAQLFVKRARAASPGFAIKPSDGNALAEICVHLDGLPLAIELAALRTESVDLRNLSIELRKSAPLLSRSNSHHGHEKGSQPSTIEASLQWSFVLLSPAEQTILTQLSVFRTRFSEAAALAVAWVPELTADTLRLAIDQLIARSFIMDCPDDPAGRFKIPRAYRGQLYSQLIERHDSEAVLARHARYVHEMVRRLTPGRNLVPREHVPALYGVVEEIRAALAWSFSLEGDAVIGLELLGSAAHVWCHVSQFSEYVAAGQKALEATADQHATLAEPRMRLSIALGISMYSVDGATQAMHDLLLSGLRIATERNDLFWKSLALRGLWKFFHGSSEQADALLSANASLQVARAASFGSSHATLKAATYLYAGSLKRAKRYLNYAVHISDPKRIPHLTTDQSDQRVFDLCMHARCLWQTGQFASAIDVAETCLDDVMAKGRPIAIIAALSLAICPIYCWSGQVDMAEKRLRILEQYAALYEMDHWSRYGEVFRLGQSFTKEDVPGLRKKTNIMLRPWSQRHIEEFSVLRDGFVTPSLVAVARSNKPIWCSAENLRLYANKRLQQNGTDGRRYVDHLLRQSLDIARQQSAVGWELRTSLTLGRMLSEQDQYQDAKDLVESVLQKIQDKPLTADHIEALAFVEGQAMRAVGDRIIS